MLVPARSACRATASRPFQRLRAGAVLGLLLATGSAAACENYTLFPDVALDTLYASAPTAPGVFMSEERGRYAWRQCSLPGGPVSVFVRLDIPGLRYVSDVQYEGRTYATYASSDDSALLAFDTYWDTFDKKPLRLGEELETLYETAAGSGEQNVISHRVLVFSRGGRMRTSSVRTGNFSLRSPAYPVLDSSASYYLAPQFPITTCPMQDVTETLQDVQYTELPTPGSTAKEKRLVVRLDCGVDVPRAQITLSDATDRSNRGSQLTPTLDSDAKGVRIQLLQSGKEVEFNRISDFSPGTGGLHEIEYTARYIRTDGQLVPGLIRGEAVLDVDYW